MLRFGSRMALSISVADVWKLFSDRKKSDKEAIAKWLDEVASEGRQISTAWMEVCTELHKSGMKLNRDQRIELMDRFTPFRPNEVPYSRLRQFYESATPILGGRVHENVHTAFTRALGSLLSFRSDVKTKYDGVLSKFKTARFVDSDNSAEDLDDLDRSVFLLNREAAALEVLAKNFRASA